MDPKAILLEVLTIIEYKDDKNAFVEKFFRLLAEETMAKMISTLPAETKEKLENDLKEVKDPQVFQETIQKYFPKDAFEKELEQVSNEEFTDYLQTIYVTISKDQQEKLDTYLSTLQPTGQSL